MSTQKPEVIAESNLSIAWGRAFLHAIAPDSGHAPLIISVNEFNSEGKPLEHLRIRTLVDEMLSAKGCMSVRKTAFTIFPDDPWQFAKRPPHASFGPSFRKWIFPVVFRANRANRSGTYFQRMVAFGAGISEEGNLVGAYVDQLSKILEFWESTATPRRSALQAACFDPRLDHHLRPRSGFPCLQQVSFSQNSEGGLAVTGYYPSEYILDRGYGNYLGLCHLGNYMANNMGLKLTRMNCIISHPLLGSAAKKTELRANASLIQRLIKEAS